MIVFGKNAEVEVPPVDFSIQLAPKIESLLDREFTNLAGAMQRAMSMFPHDAAKRIVLVTDGNQNIGERAGGSPGDGGRGREHRRDAGAARCSGATWRSRRLRCRRIFGASSRLSCGW